jgi:hypothetical protein
MTKVKNPQTKAREARAKFFLVRAPVPVYSAIP